MTPQQRMTARLETVGLPYKEIRCYGAQIVVTAWSRAAAEKWASVLGHFSKVRGVIQSYDNAKENKGTMLKPSMVTVWRVFARITAESLP